MKFSNSSWFENASDNWKKGKLFLDENKHDYTEIFILIVYDDTNFNRIKYKKWRSWFVFNVF